LTGLSYVLLYARVCQAGPGTPSIHYERTITMRKYKVGLGIESVALKYIIVEAKNKHETEAKHQYAYS
jgi:hypothetical protein